jgi:hypothetical protein
MDRALCILTSVLLVSCGKETPPPGASPAASRPPPGTSALSPKLSSWKESGDFLGPGWLGSTGLVMDDTADVSALAGPERAAAESLLPALRSAGVVSCADFTYSRRDRPAAVTLRVLVFKDVASAGSWWKAKYESPEAEKLYRKVEAAADTNLALDSKEMPKRIVLLRNVVMTCGQLDETGEHLKVLERYLAKLRS